MIGIDPQIIPSLSLAIVDRHLGWALTLSALTLFFLKAAPRLLRYSLGLGVFLLSIAPTSWSISHWLGLAYQTPSLVFQILSLLYLLRLSKGSTAGQNGTTLVYRWPTAVLLLACLTGWALALDTFAKLSIQLYALGYSKDLSVGLLLVAMLIWIFGKFHPSAQSGRRFAELAVILLIAILIHTLTRLPSGNLWDAVLDPWLWLVAQGALIGRVATGARRMRGATLGSA
jgi:hypothetical protein